MSKIDILLKFLLVVVLSVHCVLFFQYLYPEGKEEENELYALQIKGMASQIEANKNLIEANNKLFVKEEELVAEIKKIRELLEAKTAINKATTEPVTETNKKVSKKN